MVARQIRLLVIAATALALLAIVASIVFWGMRLREPVVARNVVVATLPVESDVVTALYGYRPAASLALGNLVLTGVVVAPDPRDSVAILAESGRPARPVVVGGSLAGGVRLLEVHRTHVVVSDGGQTGRVDLATRSGGDVGTSGGVGTSGSGLPPLPAAADDARPPNDEDLEGVVGAGPPLSVGSVPQQPVGAGVGVGTGLSAGLRGEPPHREGDGTE